MDALNLPESSVELSNLNARLSNVEFAINFFNSKFVIDFDEIISLLSPVNHQAKLFRSGISSDGGYIFCETDDANPRIISLGLGSEVSCEAELLELGYEVIAADGSVENPFPENPRFKFVKSHIASSPVSGFPTLNFVDFLRYFEWDTEVELIKIDIEGGEYELLSHNLLTILKSRQLVIEFHGFELLGDQNFRDILINLLKSIHRTHKPIHVHANNGAPGIRMAGGEWPTLLEVTFLRNEECINSRNLGPFPTNLDFPNTSLRPDIDLNPFFGTSPSYLQLVKFISSSLDLA